MEKYHDIARLRKADTLVKKIYALIYHMDGNEYKRFRTYIDSKHGVSFPYNYPTPHTEEKEG
jgi:hypothetical protein